MNWALHIKMDYAPNLRKCLNKAKQTTFRTFHNSEGNLVMHFHKTCVQIYFVISLNFIEFLRFIYPNTFCTACILHWNRRNCSIITILKSRSKSAQNYDAGLSRRNQKIIPWRIGPKLKIKPFRKCVYCRAVLSPMISWAPVGGVWLVSNAPLEK